MFFWLRLIELYSVMVLFLGKVDGCIFRQGWWLYVIYVSLPMSLPSHVKR